MAPRLTAAQKFVIALIVLVVAAFVVPGMFLWNGRPLVTPCIPSADASQHQQQQQQQECIPNVLHFIKADNGTRPFAFAHFLAWYSAVRNMRPDRVALHADVAPSGPWWALVARHPDPRMRELHALRPPPAPPGRTPATLRYQHASDFARLALLAAEGGVYMDLDSLALRPLRPRVLCSGFAAVVGFQHERRREVAVGVIAARPGAFAAQLLNRSLAAYDGRWTTHSVKLLSREVAGDPRVLLLHPDALYPFYPRIEVLAGSQAVPVPNGTLQEEAAAAGAADREDAFSWCQTYAIHLFASHKKMADALKRADTPCGALLQADAARRAPLQDAMAALVCAALADGTLPANETAACPDAVTALCTRPYASFFPCFEGTAAAASSESPP